MDDTLQRLLDAEVRAEKIAQQAEAEQDSIIEGALAKARAQEDRFRDRIPDLHRSFMGFLGQKPLSYASSWPASTGPGFLGADVSYYLVAQC